MDLATRLLGLGRRTPPAGTEGQPPTVCPGCGSTLVQHQGWRELPDGNLLIHLRCPECLIRMSATFAADRVAEYDDALLKGRAALVADYEALVRHNMGELANRFRRALELDLIGADDFGLLQGTPSPAASIDAAGKMDLTNPSPDDD